MLYVYCWVNPAEEQKDVFLCFFVLFNDSQPFQLWSKMLFSCLVNSSAGNTGLLPWMALMLSLQGCSVHLHSFTAWWTLWTDGMKWWGKEKRYAWQCKLTHRSGACRRGRTVLLVPSIWRADDPERTQISQNNSGADPARHTDAQRTSTGLQLNLLLSRLIQIHFSSPRQHRSAPHCPLISNCPIQYPNTSPTTPHIQACRHNT